MSRIKKTHTRTSHHEERRMSHSVGNVATAAAAAATQKRLKTAVTFTQTLS